MGSRRSSELSASGAVVDDVPVTPTPAGVIDGITHGQNVVVRIFPGTLEEGRLNAGRELGATGELAAGTARCWDVATLAMGDHAGTAVIPATLEDVVNGVGTVVERPVTARVVPHGGEVDEALICGDISRTAGAGGDAKAERDETDEYDSTSGVSEHSCSS